MMNDEREERPLRLFNSAFRIPHSLPARNVGRRFRRRPSRRAV